MLYDGNRGITSLGQNRVAVRCRSLSCSAASSRCKAWARAHGLHHLHTTSPNSPSSPDAAINLVWCADSAKPDLLPASGLCPCSPSTSIPILRQLHCRPAEDGCGVPPAARECKRCIKLYQSVALMVTAKRHRAPALP